MAGEPLNIKLNPDGGDGRLDSHTHSLSHTQTHTRTHSDYHGLVGVQHFHGDMSSKQKGGRDV